jgi:hypothetical protein
MGMLHQSQGKGYKISWSSGVTSLASRVAKQPQDSTEVEPIHNISQRPQFAGLSGELGVASSRMPIQTKMRVGEVGDR